MGTAIAVLILMLAILIFEPRDSALVRRQRENRDTQVLGASGRVLRQFLSSRFWYAYWLRSLGLLSRVALIADFSVIW